MGLSTVVQTALSGMSAATTRIEVIADNLANLETPGFKAAAVQYATLPPQTIGWGAGPVQIGRGVFVAGISRDFSPGAVVPKDQPALLALDGEGLFILEGRDAARRYTRDGNFHFNGDGQLATSDGDLVLGFGIDAAGSIDRTRLVPLTIRLSSPATGAGGPAAKLQSYSVRRDGWITGWYTDGVARPLGQLRIARFANPAGLAARFGNTFESTQASGTPTESDPGEAGAAELISGAIERSNVNPAAQLIELTLAENMFRANLAVLYTADTLLGELFFPWRK